MIKKRFIAGAVCPECQQQDTLMLLIDGEQEQLSCVACGHQQSKPDATPAPAGDGLIGVFDPEGRPQ